jgi:hypothetical protein
MIAALACAPSVASAQPTQNSQTLQEGLQLFEFGAVDRRGDGRLFALRVDPDLFEFTLLTQRLTGRRQTARAWAAQHGLAATVNAAMFAPDGRPVSYCKVDNRVVTPRVSQDRSVFVFDAAGARLIDRAFETFDPADHANALQGIRMIGADGANVWAQQPRQWSIACLATDRRGRVLFLHKRAPMSVRDFIEAVQRLPLELARCMYLEGGPEATLYVNAGGVELERFGSFETGFNENDDNDHAWPLPNVIGVRRKES